MKACIILKGSSSQLQTIGFANSKPRSLGQLQTKLKNCWKRRSIN